MTGALNRRLLGAMGLYNHVNHVDGQSSDAIILDQSVAAARPSAWVINVSTIQPQ